MRFRDDGSVQSSNTPTPQNLGKKEDFGLYRCMVTRVIYADDPDNISLNATNPRVLYDVVVLGGFASGQIISNCRLASILGGNFNYYERVLRASSKSVSKTRLDDHDGDIVYVQFNQGQYPTITSLDQGLQTRGEFGARRADGPISKHKYNGIESLIDKDGNFTWTRYGGVLDSTLGAFVPSSEENIKTEITANKIAVTLASGINVVVDGNSDFVTIIMKDGSAVEVKGQTHEINLTTSTGAELSLDGTANEVQLKSNGVGQLKISGDKVALGTPSAEVLAQISAQLEALVTLFAAAAGHTHLGNLGYSTVVPDVAAAWTTAGTTMASIKGLIDGIKGTL